MQQAGCKAKPEVGIQFGAGGATTPTKPKIAPKPFEGYLIALANLDRCSFRIIRGSANRDEARCEIIGVRIHAEAGGNIRVLVRNEARLVDSRYAFSEHQANQIIELRLYQ